MILLLYNQTGSIVNVFTPAQVDNRHESYYDLTEFIVKTGRGNQWNGEESVLDQFKKRDTFIPYNVPNLTDREFAEVVDTLKSGWVAKGPRTAKFEKEFAEYLGAKHAIAMNSCTAALHISLAAKGIGPGDEVITTPMTFASTASTILHTGATPVFADIDYQTGCIDPEEIEKKITPRTKAIVPVHYSGQVCDLDRIYELADQYGLYVSEAVSYTHLNLCAVFRRNANSASGIFRHTARRVNCKNHRLCRHHIIHQLIGADAKPKQRLTLQTNI